MRRFVVTVTAAAALLGGCARDKVLDARKWMATDPARAAELLRQAAAETSPCFDCQLYLGLALERQGDLPGATTAYEAALAIPEAEARPEPVAPRLLALYQRQFDAAAANTPARAAIARKAAALEAKLKVSSPWANTFLAEAARKDVAAAAAAGKIADVKAAATAAQALYLPVEAKRQASMDATEALKALFVTAALKAFDEKAAKPLEEKGLVDRAAAHVTLTNRFAVPDDDAAYDPDEPKFKVNLRKGACQPLRKSLEELVAVAAPAIGIHAPAASDLDGLFASLFEHAAAGWLVPGAEKRPAGQTYLCQVRVPVKDFLADLYRFSE